jgi:hypothetical protein
MWTIGPLPPTVLFLDGRHSDAWSAGCPPAEGGGPGRSILGESDATPARGLKSTGRGIALAVSLILAEAPAPPFDWSRCRVPVQRRGFLLTGFPQMSVTVSRLVVGCGDSCGSSGAGLGSEADQNATIAGLM